MCFFLKKKSYYIYSPITFMSINLHYNRILFLIIYHKMQNGSLSPLYHHSHILTFIKPHKICFRGNGLTIFYIQSIMITKVVSIQLFKKRYLNLTFKRIFFLFCMYFFFISILWVRSCYQCRINHIVINEFRIIIKYSYVHLSVFGTFNASYE